MWLLIWLQTNTFNSNNWNSHFELYFIYYRLRLFTTKAFVDFDTDTHLRSPPYQHFQKAERFNLWLTDIECNDPNDYAVEILIKESLRNDDESFSVSSYFCLRE